MKPFCFPNHFEAWQLDNSWRDLDHAATLIRLGLPEAGFVGPDQLHASWLSHYNKLLKREQHILANDLIQGGSTKDPAAALASAMQSVGGVPYPDMSLDGAYPAVEVPPILPRRTCQA